MLVLSRKIGEKLVIGDNITVIVSRVAGNRVTLGVEAPADVRIIRGELKLKALETAGEEAPSARTANGFEQETDTARASIPSLAK
jgi:carbon storage regulator